MSFKKGLHQVLFLSTLALTTAYADVTARLSGTIQDQQGAVVAGAKITATEQSTSRQATATSSSSGEYVLLQLPIGT